MGGPTMKTAKVWKYFDQLPSIEQAAECKICCKRIKATNSSTTGMIRHLRSCHTKEYQKLQEERQIGSTMIQENRTLNTKQLNVSARNKPKEMTTSHTVANIIAKQFKPEPSENNGHCLYTDANSDPLEKKAKFEECCSAVDLRIERKGNKTMRKEQTEKIRKVKENFWPDDHPDARRITDQIGIMLLLDNELAVLNRAGFRNLIRVLQPKYQLPSVEHFAKVILPRLCHQLKVGTISVQQNNYLNNQQNELSTRLNTLSTAFSGKKNGAGALIANENGSELVPLNTAQSSEQNDLDRVVINSIRSAQNISQSFSHSIQLCDEDSDSSADSEAALPARIDSFIKYVGDCVFPQAELTDLLTRCYYAKRHLEESVDDGQQRSGSSVPTSSRSSDLRECVEYVYENLERIHDTHERCPIPMFKPFTKDETQFLSDLIMHIQSM